MCNRSSVSGPYLPPALSVSVSAVCITFQQKELENSFRQAVSQNQVIFQLELEARANVSMVKFSGAYQSYQLQSKGFAGYCCEVNL